MELVSNEISWALGVVSCAILFGASAGAARVSSLEHGELEVASDWVTLEEQASQGSARLLEARLSQGHAVDFELCSTDSMDPGVWADQLELELVRTDVVEVIFAVPVDSRMLQAVARSPYGACVVFARVDSLTIDANRLAVAVDAQLRNHPAAIATVPIRARVLARRPLERVDLLIVVSLLGLALGWVLLVAWLRVPSRPVALTDAGRPAFRLAIGAGSLLIAGVALGWFGPRGATGGLVGGLALAAMQIGAALVLTRGADLEGRLHALGMVSSVSRLRTSLSFAVAPLAGFGLFALAQMTLRAWPSSGTTPIELFVRWPSGMLSIAVLAVIAPIAEEIFFRGFVYGVMRGEKESVAREAWAVLGTTALFGAAHLPQDWGHWGGVIAVMSAGLGFGLLRAAFRTTLVPCLAHLVYNGLLAVSIVAPGTS